MSRPPRQKKTGNEVQLNGAHAICCCRCLPVLLVVRLALAVARDCGFRLGFNEGARAGAESTKARSLNCVSPPPLMRHRATLALTFAGQGFLDL